MLLCCSNAARMRLLAFSMFTMTAAAHAKAGELVVVGTGDGIEIFQALASEFRQVNPSIKVVIPKSVGSDGAVKAVLAKENELGRVARPLSAEEAGKGLAVQPLMRIPSVIIAHAETKITGLTNEQLVAVFSGRFTNWKEVGGADLPIKVIVREDGDSVFKVLRASMPGWNSIKIAPGAEVVSTTTQDLINVVSKTQGAVGFAPYSVVQRSSLTMLKIDGRAPTDATYPSAVSIGIVHGPEPLSADAKAFVTFAQSAEGGKVVRWLGAVAAK